LTSNWWTELFSRKFGDKLDSSASNVAVNSNFAGQAALAAPLRLSQDRRQMNEAALIRAAQAGDEEAFARLVQTYDQQVLKLAYSLLRSQEEAYDIYQEAFLRVHKNLSRFRFDCSFHTWLYRIVTNLCLDALRRRKARREEQPVVETAEGPRDRLETAPEQRADLDPQRRMLSKELSARIRDTLSQFTPRERLVFELRHYEGMRLRAIGEMLGTTEEAAKNCLFRATQKMRAALGDFL
jgi:RNA polymerase sigma-70 factor (ECF subfamily)